MEPPKYATNVTSMVKYRSALRRWIKVPLQLLKADSKAKSSILGAVHLVFLSCNRIAQGVRTKTRMSGVRSFDGIFVNKIIGVITRDISTIKVSARWTYSLIFNDDKEPCRRGSQLLPVDSVDQLQDT